VSGIKHLLCKVIGHKFEVKSGGWISRTSGDVRQECCRCQHRRTVTLRIGGLHTQREGWEP